jgi:hypothetical protein
MIFARGDPEALSPLSRFGKAALCGKPDAINCISEEKPQQLYTFYMNYRFWAYQKNVLPTRQPLINSGSPLACRAVYNQGPTLQEGWLPFKSRNAEC